jgi:ribosomal protein S18 acetylase RimI-like enzyme
VFLEGNEFCLVQYYRAEGDHGPRTVLVRPARPVDEPALHAINLSTWSPLVSPGPRPPADQPFFAGRLRAEDVLVAERDGVVGFAIVTTGGSMPSHEHVLVLNGLAVDPARQGAGIGRLLVEAAVERARHRGARKLTLRVLAGNVPARRLYESCGFVVEGVLVGEYRLQGQDVDDVLMALDLTGAC